MKKLWFVIRYEYLRHVLRKGFILAVLSVPFWLLLMLVVVFILVSLETDDKPLGYVDNSGLLENPIQLSQPAFPETLIPMVSYEREELARAALEAGELQVYFVLPAQYPESLDVQMVYVEQPASSAISQFRDFLRRNLLERQSPQVAQRLIGGPEIRFVTLTEEDSSGTLGVVFRFLLPAFGGIVLMVAIFTSSGYLMQAVVDEKENRTMEIMITSVSPTQLMAGKVLGLIAVGLTQILLWLFMGLAVLFTLTRSLTIFSLPRLDLGNFWLVLAVIIPAFVMVSALMAAIGATVTEAREGSQITGLITLPIMIPFILFGVLAENPDGVLAIALSVFPLTAPMTILIRSGFTLIPAWQLALSIGLLVFSAAGSLWLAGQAFRLGMLRYGQRVRLNELFEFAFRGRKNISET